MSQTRKQYVEATGYVIRNGDVPRGGVVICGGCRWPMPVPRGRTTKPLCRACRRAEVDAEAAAKSEVARLLAELNG